MKLRVALTIIALTSKGRASTFLTVVMLYMASPISIREALDPIYTGRYGSRNLAGKES